MTIEGNGKLTAIGDHGAGIGGGGPWHSCQNIIINDGIICAYGGERDQNSQSNCGAGIGGGCTGNTKNIKITGGKILAVGASLGGAGIGGAAHSRNGMVSNIEISGGLVVAIGGGSDYGTAGAGIGSGGGEANFQGASHGITISGEDTVVIAVGGESKSSGKHAEDLGGGLSSAGVIGQNDDYDAKPPLISEEYYGTIFGVTIEKGTIIHAKKDTVPDIPDEPEPPCTPDIPVIPAPPKPDPPEEPDPPDTPDYPEKPEPSKRPAYTEGSAEMTYANGLILQTNSRSKDAVLFTFKYKSEGIGDLKNDLNCTAKGLGLEELSMATQEKANYAIDRLDHALCKATMIRSTFGAAVNRLEHKSENLANIDENLTEAESNIRDTDMALELMNFTKGQVVMNAAQAMLAQANTQNQSVLNLLGE